MDTKPGQTTSAANAGAPLNGLLHALSELPELREIANALRQGKAVEGAVEHLPPEPPNLALPRAARLPAAVALWKQTGVPVLYVASRADKMLARWRELEHWHQPRPNAPALLLPEPPTLLTEQAPWDERTRAERLLALSSLAAHFIPGAERTAPLILTTPHALMTRTMPRRAFVKSSLRVRAGTTISPHALARKLAQLGYEPVSVVTARGEFATRGGIVDLWPPAANAPIRLDFFGDEVDSLRSFDPSTQRTTHAVETALITPAREFLLPPEWAEPIPGEAAIARLHPDAASPLTYLPPRAIVLIDDWEAFRDAVAALEEQAASQIAPDSPRPYAVWEEITAALPPRTLALGPAGEAAQLPPRALAHRFAQPQHYGGQLKPFMADLRRAAAGGDLAWIVSRQAERLRDLWRKPAENEPRFIKGSLEAGFALRTAKRRYHLLTDREIFGWRPPKVRRRPRPKPAPPEIAYADLRPGDYVVHTDFGIGRFGGIVTRTLEGKQRDYLLIEYAQGDQLFVPVHQADRITRYVGPGDQPPTITRLGSGDWQTAKRKVREAVQKIAEELLELHAKRQVARGHAFSPDTEWQRELEASFPYVETEDQLRAIAAVKRDMESPRPMDRLICGDVGYGKTEVALRAAFKAVMDGKQVAMLVPTTVLAQQHFQTFRRRLAAFPVEVEMLSRFRTPAQQRGVINRLSAGQVDIVIGTHRLLSPDVEFKDLGLVIIDEEQRFGVTHKEHFKRLRATVDVLTLTATPIPRTLYLALTGVRDISVIETPPAERLPISTYVGPYDPKKVRTAILREIDRGGQVFFVHNRVRTILAMRRALEKLVPEARFAVAHGQMPERELAAVMEKFAAGEVDVLITTTIIESGLDFPNANTLIVDRADALGLAQLYQLRGRVGRGAVHAYAYFFRHPRKAPTPEGRQRLETLAENTHLGAGYAIAMRDLEIRGAGEILGTRQHGHMAAVGFHLYTKLLAAAVERLRGKEPKAAPAERPPVSVELPLEIGLPPEYIPEMEQRLALYRRFANITSEEELEAALAELRDRFGEPPPPVENLFFQLRVKILAERAGVESVHIESGQIVLKPKAALRKREGGLPPLPPPWRTGRRAYWLARREGWREELVRGLRELEGDEGLRN